MRGSASPDLFLEFVETSRWRVACSYPVTDDSNIYHLSQKDKTCVKDKSVKTAIFFWKRYEHKVLLHFEFRPESMLLEPLYLVSILDMQILGAVWDLRDFLRPLRRQIMFSIVMVHSRFTVYYGTGQEQEYSFRNSVLDISETFETSWDPFVVK